MTHYELPISSLSAAILAAATKDVRVYLNGVYLDFQKGRIAATNGSWLFCGQIPKTEQPPVILPRELVERVLRAHKALPLKERRNVAAVTLTVEGEDLRVAVRDSILAGKAIDARFPEYERVIVTEPTGETAQYNPEYLVAAQNAIQLYTGQMTSYQPVQYNGSGPALITGFSCLSVVMPMRVGGSADLGWYTGAV